jgi:hypothetical protein
MRSSPAFLIAAMRATKGAVNGQIDWSSQTDVNVGKMAAAVAPLSLQNLSPALRTNRLVALTAVRADPKALQVIDPSLTADTSFLKEAVAENPDALAYAPDSVRNDRTFMQDVVRHAPNAFQYAGSSLLHDPDLLKQAVTADPDLIWYVRSGQQPPLRRLARLLHRARLLRWRLEHVRDRPRCPGRRRTGDDLSRDWGRRASRTPTGTQFCNAGVCN